MKKKMKKIVSLNNSNHTFPTSITDKSGGPNSIPPKF